MMQSFRIFRTIYMEIYDLGGDNKIDRKVQTG